MSQTEKDFDTNLLAAFAAASRIVRVFDYVIKSSPSADFFGGYAKQTEQAFQSSMGLRSVFSHPIGKKGAPEIIGERVSVVTDCLRTISNVVPSWYNYDITARDMINYALENNYPTSGRSASKFMDYIVDTSAQIHAFENIQADLKRRQSTALQLTM